MTQLRLAERQGLLSGPSLSPIQSYGASVLDTVEYLEKIKNDDRQVRLALLTSAGHEALSTLFPEYADVVVDDEADLDDGVDAEGNAVATRYDFSHAEHVPSQAEVEAEVAEMLARAASGEASFEAPTFSEWV